MINKALMQPEGCVYHVCTVMSADFNLLGRSRIVRGPQQPTALASIFNLANLAVHYNGYHSIKRAEHALLDMLQRTA